MIMHSIVFGCLFGSICQLLPFVELRLLSVRAPKEKHPSVTETLPRTIFKPWLNNGIDACVSVEHRQHQYSDELSRMCRSWFEPKPHSPKTRTGIYKKNGWLNEQHSLSARMIIRKINLQNHDKMCYNQQTIINTHSRCLR